jgi:hypothetical protein
MLISEEEVLASASESSHHQAKHEENKKEVRQLQLMVSDLKLTKLMLYNISKNV